MDEDENNVSLEDALEGHIGELIDDARTLQAGSDEHVAVVKEIKELYDTCIRYTEVGMRYESEEAQRQHELEMKKLDLVMKNKEIEMNQMLKEAELKAQTRNMIIDSAIKGTSLALSAGTVASFVAMQVLQTKAEYGDMRFMTSSSFRNISNIFGRFIKPPMM